MISGRSIKQEDSSQDVISKVTQIDDVEVDHIQEAYNDEINLIKEKLKMKKKRPVEKPAQLFAPHDIKINVGKAAELMKSQIDFNLSECNESSLDGRQKGQSDTQYGDMNKSHSYLKFESIKTFQPILSVKKPLININQSVVVLRTETETNTPEKTPVSETMLKNNSFNSPRKPIADPTKIINRDYGPKNHLQKSYDTAIRT